jgi:hypothetical protein
MTAARLRWWLALFAIALGAAAAIAGTPGPPHARATAKAAIYKPPSGC